MEDNKQDIIYDVICDENSQVTAISVVENPANESEFMLFNEVEHFKANSDEQIITGIVLIPNQIIPRRGYSMKFSADAIKTLSIDFYKNGYQTNSNLSHKEDLQIDDCVFFESWIVNDPLNDKANSLGFKDIVKGTWFTSMKVNNIDTWNKIKNGNFYGFSIEAFLSKKLATDLSAELNKKEGDTKMSLIKELKKIVDKLSDVDTTDTTDANTDANEVNEVNEVNLSAYEVGQQVENKGVEYNFVENGQTIYVDANGIIIKIEPVEAELPELPRADMTAEADAATTEIEKDLTTVKDETSKPVEQVDIEALLKAIKDLQDQVAILKSEKEKIAMEVVELSKTPAVTKLSANQVDEKPKTRLEILASLANKK